MSAPTQYTEQELAAFMLKALGDVAGVLGWADLYDIEEPVNEALLAYGVSDIADATDITKIRTLARREAWRAAVASLVTRYDFDNPEGSYSRSQMLEGAQQALVDAEMAAGEYDSAAAVGITTVRRIHDPYVPLDTDAQVLS